MGRSGLNQIVLIPPYTCTLHLDQSRRNPSGLVQMQFNLHLDWSRCNCTLHLYCIWTCASSATGAAPLRRRAKREHTRQSRPDSGLVLLPSRNACLRPTTSAAPLTAMSLHDHPRSSQPSRESQSAAPHCSFLLPISPYLSLSLSLSFSGGWRQKATDKGGT